MKLKIMTFFIGLGLMGCSSLESYKPKPKAKPAPAQGLKAFSQIKKRNKKETLQQTLEKLQTFIKANKDNDLALSAYLYMARLLYKYNKKEEACKAYWKAVSLPFSYANQNRAVYASARCLQRKGQMKKALNLLESRLRIEQETLSHKKEMASLQWKFVKNEKGFKKWKLKVLSHLIHFNPRSKKTETYREKARKLLEEFKDSDLLELARRAKEFRSFEGLILFMAGEVAWKKKNLSKARAYFTSALTRFLEPSLEKKASHYLKIIESQKKVNPKRIGVILPLTGKRKSLGRKVLKGLQMGLGLTENSSYQLIIRDSKNHPDVARSSARKLFHNHHVIALVGGLSSETAEGIAEMATELAVPALLFSQKAGLTTDHHSVFQNAVASGSLVAQLVQVLFKKSSMKKFSILYPEDSYGKEYKALFEEEVKKYKGSVVSAESYKSGETDFKESLKKLVNLYDLKDRKEEYEKLKEDYLKKHSLIRSRKKKLRPENLLKPVVDFDGLFIPDSIGVLKKVVAHLKYFGIKDVSLIGTNLWKPEDIQPWSQDFSTFFINTPPLSEKKKKASPFFIKWRKEFLSSPGLFEQRAFNTGLALRTALEKDSQNRIDLQKNLEKLENLKGAYFPFEISENRVFTYPLTIYSSKKGRAFLLDSIPVR